MRTININNKIFISNSNKESLSLSLNSFIINKLSIYLHIGISLSIDSGEITLFGDSQIEKVVRRIEKTSRT